MLAHRLRQPSFVERRARSGAPWRACTTRVHALTTTERGGYADVLASSIPSRPSFWRGALLGTAALVALVLLRLALEGALYRSTPFLLQLIAVLVAAWFGGFGAGALTTAIAAALGYIDLTREPGGALAGVLVHVLVFSSEGLLIAWLTARLGRERARALAAADAAREAGDKLAVVLDGMTDGITMQDHSGRLVYANEAAAHVCGFSSAPELLAAPIGQVLERFRLFDANGAPLPLERLPNRALFSGGLAEETLVQYELAGSSERHWSTVRANGLRAPDGRLSFVVNVFRDVTERQRQDEALRVSREWLSTALRSIGDAVITSDTRGTITFLNPAAVELTGWSAEEAQGRALSDVFAIIDEHTRAPRENPVALVLERGSVVDVGSGTLLVRKDRSEVAIADSAAPIKGTSGELAGVVLVFRDVTAERRDLERREFLSRAMLELSASLDYERTLATIARLAVPRIADWCAVDIREDGRLRRLAVAHVDPAKVQHVLELQRRYPNDENANSGAAKVLRSGRAEHVRRIPAEMLAAAARDEEHLRLIQELQLHSYIGVPMVHAGTTLGVITLVMAESKREYDEKDLALITALADRAAVAVENARLFRAAEQARSEAVLANRAKDDFLAILGHELRNPLAPIVTALELMEQRGGDTQRERRVIERQVKHVVRLVDDLLDVARIVRGAVTLAREEVQVTDVVDKAIELAGPLLQERQHTIERSVPPGLCLVTDGVRLTQVLTNLLTNAAKYTEPRGRIQIRVEADAGSVTFRIADNGMGIAPEMLSRIFDMFVQAPQALDRAQGGLGLGLTIVQSLVRLFGGSVRAHSNGPGQGSEFIVNLPNQILSAAHQPPAERPSTSAAPAPRARVLVVDDNQDALEMLVEALGILGHEAHGAVDVASALEIAARVRPDLALLDIGLPVMDGYELGRQLKALPGLDGIKLVALTGYGQSSDREKSTAAGFAAHLVKPVELQAIGALIRDLAS
jgi:PAS domain S-box-containing protein